MDQQTVLPPPPPPSDISPDDASTASAMIEKKSSLLTNQILSGLEQRHQQRMANPSAIPQPIIVDESIARRRAELRRLQQQQGGAPGFSGHTASSLARSGIVSSGTSTLASARTRLGGGVPKPPSGAVRPHVEEMVRLASSLPAPSTKTKMPGRILKPMPPTAPDVVVAAPINFEVTPPHPTSPVQIPSTATITRRLDYAETTNEGGGVFMPVPRLPPQSEGEHNDEDVIEHHNRRTSEIFPVGKSPQQPKQVISVFEGGSTVGEKESMTQNNPPPPSLPTFNIFSPTGPSERGATIKTISSSETVQVVRSSGVVRVPPMAVPQSTSNLSTSATSNTKTNISKSAFTATEINRRRREQRRATEEKEKETLSAPSVSPPTLVEEIVELKNEEEMTSVVTEITVTSPTNGSDDIDATNSGRDTPVHSNVHEDVQRLKNMLESAEREKKEALQEVEKLKLRLDLGSGDENQLLSSVIPPLTPRSRPGSRAASPEHHIDVSAAPVGRLGGKRTNTPLPRPASSSSVEDIFVEDKFLLKAAQCIPNEYGTRLATYFVRRPYVNDDDVIVDSGTSWTQYAHISPREEYLRIATTSDPNTLEVLAYVEADRSVFTLTGHSDARHGRPSSSEESSPLEWNIFNNVEDMDRALGKVTHIDVDGNERDYWLDSIYEEALTTRESYCMSLISASYALKEVMQGGSFTAQTTIPLQQSQYDRAIDIPQSAEPAYQAMRMSDTGTSSIEQTSEKLLRHEPLAVLGDRQHLPENKLEDTHDTSKLDANESSTKTQPDEELYEPSDSALTFMVLSLFSLLFSIAWFIIKIPIKICTLLIRFVLMMVILRVLWILLEDDNGACDMGACIDYKYYNIPGIY